MDRSRKSFIACAESTDGQPHGELVRFCIPKNMPTQKIVPAAICQVLTFCMIRCDEWHAFAPRQTIKHARTWNETLSPKAVGRGIS